VIAPTHIVVGQFAYLVGALVAGHPPSAPEAVAAGAAALLPDIDKRSGYVGRWLPWLSGPIEEAVGHRTATHSLLALAVVAVVAWPLPTGWYIAVVAGFGSHAVADMMTPSGVAWFWPARARCVIPGNAAYRIEAMSIPELWVAVLVGLLSWPVLAMAQGGTGALGAVRDLIGDMGSARQHYDAHKSEADWWLTVRGQDNRGFQAVEGRYRVIAPFRATGLIVEGPRGPVSVCRSGECDWYVERAVIERGEPEVTTTRDVRLSQTTVDALREALAPLSEVGRVYLVGQARSARVPVSPPTVAVAQDRVTLSFAPLAELDAWPAGPLRDVDVRVQVRHPPGASVPPLGVEAAASRLPLLLERHLP
jgi:inner membrane protein